MSQPLFTRRFLVLWLFAFLTFFSAFQLLPAIPLRILKLGGSKAAAGWFLSFYTFASAMSAPLMGNIADHVGRKRMLMFASALFIVFSVLYGVVTSIPLLLVIAVVHGAIWSGLMASASAIMSEFIPEGRRTEGLAYWGLASTAAIGLAPAVGFLIYERAGWTVLCTGLAAISLVMLVWSWRLPVTDAHRLSTPHSMRDAWDTRVIFPALSLAVVCFGYGGVTSYTAILARERHIHPESLYFSVFAGAIVLIRLFAARIGDRIGTTVLLYPSYAVIPIAFLVLAMATTRWEMAVSATLFGFGLGGAYPAFANFLLTHTDPQRRARTFGTIVWAFDTGIATGSVSIGLIGQRYSLGAAFGTAAVVSCLAIPIFMVTSKRLAASTG